MPMLLSIVTLLGHFSLMNTHNYTICTCVCHFNNVFYNIETYYYASCFATLDDGNYVFIAYLHDNRIVQYVG